MNIKKYEKIAKKYNNEKKVGLFLAYNKKCSEMVKKESDCDKLLVRYWLSSLTAAYADCIYDYNKVMKMSVICLEKMERPDYIIRLRCNFNERIRRIEERNSSEFDDKTMKRNIDYQYITDKIIEKTPMLNWIEIDTSNLNQEQVFDAVHKKIYS